MITTQTELHISGKKLHSMIVESYKEALAEFADLEVSKRNNAKRSSKFVKCLAERFEAVFAKIDGFQVFYSKEDEGEEKKKEVMFDIHVYRMEKLKAMKHNTTIDYIKEPMWQIESELAANKRSATADFSKLVAGSAENKLFIRPASRDYNPDTLLPIANSAKKQSLSRIFLSLIPQPKKWVSETTEEKVKTFLYDKKLDKWISIV